MKLEDAKTGARSSRPQHTGPVWHSWRFLLCRRVWACELASAVLGILVGSGARRQPGSCRPQVTGPVTSRGDHALAQLPMVSVIHALLAVPPAVAAERCRTCIHVVLASTCDSCRVVPHAGSLTLCPVVKEVYLYSYRWAICLEYSQCCDCNRVHLLLIIQWLKAHDRQGLLLCLKRRFHTIY